MSARHVALVFLTKDEHNYLSREGVSFNFKILKKDKPVLMQIIIVNHERSLKTCTGYLLKRTWC